VAGAGDSVEDDRVNVAVRRRGFEGGGANIERWSFGAHIAILTHPTAHHAHPQPPDGWTNVNERTGASVDLPAAVESPAVADHPLPSDFHFRIEPPRGWRSLDLRDLWLHRELLYFFAWRDIKVRYKQTVFGFLWAILQPFVTMVVFTFVFSRVANVSSDGLPYPVFAFAALVPWTFFSNALTLGSSYLIQTPDLITKVYFPRLLLPAASVLGGLFDFAIAFAVLLGMTFYYRIVPGPEVVFLIPLLLLLVATALAATLWFSALNVKYRDIQYAVPFLAQIWLFATPVAYAASAVPEPWRTLLGLNPMTGVVEGFRWALLGVEPAPVTIMLLSGAATLVFVLSGVYYFRRSEDSFADVI
jgi:lipopolysaccharide transport system permease protein